MRIIIASFLIVVTFLFSVLLGTAISALLYPLP